MSGLWEKLIGLLAVGLLTGACQTSMELPGDAFDAKARRLLSSIPSGARVAILPFPANEIPIPPDHARRFNDRLAAAIQQIDGKRVSIVGRADLIKVYGEAEEFGQAPNISEFIRRAAADAVIIGRMQAVAGGIEVSYAAYDPRNNRQLAQTIPKTLPYDFVTPTGFPLGQAVKHLATALREQLPEIKAVRLAGIFFQQSGVQTPLGRYLVEGIGAELSEKVARFETSPARLLVNEWRKTREGAGGALDRPAGNYILSGTLWQMGAQIEVRVRLEGAGRKSAAASVRIEGSTIPKELRMTPENLLQKGCESCGAAGLKLTSNKGPRPVYRVGDAMTFAVESARDGFLYCFNQVSKQAGHGVIKIFPNEYRPTAHIKGRQRTLIPGPGMAFVLRVHPPAGIEYLRCFVLDRDPGPALPADISGLTLRPLAVNGLQDLSRILRNLPNVRLSEATLVMTIEER